MTTIMLTTNAIKFLKNAAEKPRNLFSIGNVKIPTFINERLNAAII